eukprot:COSAG01_NODE_2260_length_8057_cov_50.825527_8_plen_230_part_00
MSPVEWNINGRMCVWGGRGGVVVAVLCCCAVLLCCCAAAAVCAGWAARTAGAVLRDPTISFSFPRPEFMAGPAIQLIDVSFAYAPAKAREKLQAAEAALQQLAKAAAAGVTEKAAVDGGGGAAAAAAAATEAAAAALQQQAEAAHASAVEQAQLAVQEAREGVAATAGSPPLFSNVNLSLDSESKVRAPDINNPAAPGVAVHGHDTRMVMRRRRMRSRRRRRMISKHEA